MAVMYKAQIVVGYELTANWNEIVDDDFFEEYINNFLTTSVYHDDFVLFGVIVEEVDEGQFVKYNDNLSFNDFTLLRRFADNYPKAIANSSRFSSIYLICKED